MLKTNLLVEQRDVTLHPSEDWDLKPATISRAARSINHPDNLPDIDFIPDETDDTVKTPGNRYNLRESIKSPLTN